MNILLLGGSGLIGSSLQVAFKQQDWQVVAPSSKQLDFKRPETWRSYLHDADVVVNAVGLMSRQQTLMRELQWQAPQALYQQALECGVAYVLQVSALGAEVNAHSEFLRSKGLLDEWLLQSPLPAGIIRPSLVFAPQGRSSQLFIHLAKQKLLLLPDAGKTVIQPVALADVVAACVAMIRQQHLGVVDAIGGEAVSMADYLQLMRCYCWQQAPARVVSVPKAAAKCAAALLQYPSEGMVTPESIEMLLESKLVQIAEFVHVLGHRPQTPEQFLQDAWS